MKLEIPTLHKFAHSYSENGFRGSHLLWRTVVKVSNFPQGSYLRTRNGFPVYIDKNDWISKTVYEGTYERALIQFLKTLALRNLFVDVGANIGYILWHGLLNSKETSKYLAFEPSEKCLGSLEAVKLLLPRTGQVLPFALSDEEGSYPLYGTDYKNHSGSASLEKHAGISEHSSEVEVRRLDLVLENLSEESSISLLKIDTEGHESRVIDGAAATLRSGKVEIAIIEISPNFGPVEFIKKIDGYLGSEYSWFILEEVGIVKKRATLRKVLVLDALNIKHQWNLVLFRKDVLNLYLNQRRSIRVDSN